VLGLIALISLASLLAVWVVYPLVISALASIAAPRSQRGEPSGVSAPTVSIIIATRDDAAAVQRRVDDCSRYSYDRAKLDVVVAIDRREGADTMKDVTRLVGGCTIVIGDAPGGKSATLNAAADVARGEVLVFTDTHQRFEPDAIEHLVAALADPRVGAASGSLDLGSGEHARTLADRYWTYELALRRNESRVHSSVGVSGAIWALRRSLWIPLPENLILDDVYTPMRVVLQGGRVAFAERACAHETRRPSIGQQYRRKVRTLTGVIQLCAWLPAVLLPLRNPIWPQFVFHKLLRLLTPYWTLAILIWGIAVGGRWLLDHPFAALGVALLVPVVVYDYWRSPRSFARRAYGAAVSFLLLQAAVVVAAANGVRRQWDVWRA
jgi:cellulose synthase/poly-beta-1,6-N-acetylglucosamine synthase-like glycosyltransferase